MMRYVSSIVVTMLMVLPLHLLVLLPPGIAAAQLQTAPDVSFLVSCSGVVSESVGDSTLPACNWCSFVQLIGNMVQYSIYLAVLLSALMFAYAGFLFLTNNGKEANITKAWAIFRRSLMGTVAILAAWLIVNAIMTKLAVGLGLGDNWNSITGCSEVSAGTTTTRPLRNNFGYNDVPGQDQVYLGNDYPLNNPVRSTQYNPLDGAVTYNDTRLVSSRTQYTGIARTKLKSKGININKTCANGTCLDKINLGTVNGAIMMKEECDAWKGSECTLWITGGNEAGHSTRGTQTHSNGYKLDWSVNNGEFHNYVKESGYFTQDSRATHGVESWTHTATGSTCVRETNPPHWDCKY